MLLIIKLTMRGAAFLIAFLVLWGAHALRPDVRMVEAMFSFCAMWMALNFAVVLLASSWVVGRAGGGDIRLHKSKPAIDPELVALRNKLSRLCSYHECEEMRIPGSQFCTTHAMRKSNGGGV